MAELGAWEVRNWHDKFSYRQCILINTICTASHVHRVLSVTSVRRGCATGDGACACVLTDAVCIECERGVWDHGK